MKGGHRAGAGRHPVGTAARSTVRRVLLTPEEDARLQDLARQEGISPSEWLARHSGIREDPGPT